MGRFDYPQWVDIRLRRVYPRSIPARSPSVSFVTVRQSLTYIGSGTFRQNPVRPATPRLPESASCGTFAHGERSDSIEYMNKFLSLPILPASLAIVGVVVLVPWLKTDPPEDMELRRPWQDRSEGDAVAQLEPTPEPGEPIASGVQPADLPGEWPWFRGPNLDGICDDGVPLARKWPATGPEIAWTVEVGLGHAGAVVSKGCVYLLDYDSTTNSDVMRCLSLLDGSEIWRNAYPIEVVENHGMSRTVAAVVDDCVISLGPKCHVAAWDKANGKCLWLLDLIRRYGTKVPDWYAGQCPLIDNGKLILAPCGKASLIAVDPKSGEVAWEAPKLSDWEMTHVSIVPMEFAGRRMYVYCGSGGVAGISATDGEILWESTAFIGKMAACPTPLIVGEGRIFLTSGYGVSSLADPNKFTAGAMMIQLKEESGRITAEPLFDLKARQFASEQHTPLFYQGHIFGVRTKPGGYQMACLDLEGNEVWNSGEDKFGHGRGPYMIADGLLFLLDDDGLLTMAEATPDGYKRLNQFQVFQHGVDAWGPMALAAGRLIVRDRTRMACILVGE